MMIKIEINRKTKEKTGLMLYQNLVNEGFDVRLRGKWGEDQHVKSGRQTGYRNGLITS